MVLDSSVINNLDFLEFQHGLGIVGKGANYRFQIVQLNINVEIP